LTDSRGNGTRAESGPAMGWSRVRCESLTSTDAVIRDSQTGRPPATRPVAERASVSSPRKALRLPLRARRRRREHEPTPDARLLESQRKLRRAGRLRGAHGGDAFRAF